MQIVPFAYKGTTIHKHDMRVVRSVGTLGVKFNLQPPEAHVHISKQASHIDGEMAATSVDDRQGNVTLAIEVPAECHVLDAGFPGELLDGLAIKCRSGLDCRASCSREFCGRSLVFFNAAHSRSIAA